MDAVLAHQVATTAVDDAWALLRTGAHTAVGLGEQPDRLPDLSEEAAHATAAQAQQVLDRITSVPLHLLPADLADSLAVARGAMHRRAQAGRWWWLVFDPLDVGFWAMYAPTAYGGGFLLDQLGRLLGAAPLATAEDVERYVTLVHDYGRVVRQLDERTRGQAERGIFLPRPQLAQAVRLLEGLRAGTGALVRGEGAVRERVAAAVAEVVDPAFAAMHAWLGDPQRITESGEAVGLSQLPGGAEVYAELVRQHLTLDLTPQEVHRLGLERLDTVRADLQAVADELGEPDAHAVLRRLTADPAWRADSAEGVAAHFQRCIDRLAPLADSVFAFAPRAAYGVAPLPASLGGSMTFGFYDKPGPDEPTGRYLFNAANLQQQHLASVAAITYHELVPGHHQHFASQLENTDLHPLRANALINAFNEGWAEYAATLAGELGGYPTPEERCGRLLMDAFLTTRLVVDTGMNALGWTLEEGRDFLRAHAFLSEAEVLTESIRYSCDLPGQALAYKLGETFLLEQRERMRTARGERFDLREFHDVVLRPGALPLSQVAANVTRALET